MHQNMQTRQGKEFISINASHEYVSIECNCDQQKLCAMTTQLLQLCINNVSTHTGPQNHVRKQCKQQSILVVGTEVKYLGFIVGWYVLISRTYHYKIM